MEFRNIVIQILNSERKGSVLHNQKNLQIKNINSLRIDTGRYPQMRFVKEPRYQIHANFKAEVIEIEKKLAEEIREAIWDCQREENYSQKVYERNIQRRLLKNSKITVISHGTIEKIDQYGNPWEEWMDGKSMLNSQGILQPFFNNVPVQGTSYVKYVQLESKTTDKKEKDKKEKSWWEKVWDDVKEYASNTWDKITSEEFLDKTIKISGTIAGAVVLGAAIVCTAGAAGAAVGAAATYLGASAAIAGVATTATTYGGYALATAVGIDAANTSVEIGTGKNYIAKGAYNLFGNKDKGEEYFLNAYREGSDFLTMLGYSYATFGAYAMQSGYSKNNNSDMSKAEIMKKNREQGRLYEQKEFRKFSKKYSNAVQQITIKTNSNERTRVDAIGTDKNGQVIIYEFKSSKTAPLTRNQEKAFTEIKQSGGEVVGKGKGIFTGGYQIPKGTEVKEIRPK